MGNVATPAALGIEVGLKSLFEYNGLTFNDRSAVDQYNVTRVTLAMPSVRDVRIKEPVAHGEIGFQSFYGGRPVIIEGQIKAGNLAKLREMKRDLQAAFSLLRDDWLYFRQNDPGLDTKILCRATALSIPDQQENLRMERGFQLTLQASNPFFLSDAAVVTDFPLALPVTSGLEMWLRGDDHAFLNSFSDGDTVTTWQDRSGLNNDGVQSTFSRRPTYQSNASAGFHCLRFDGSNDNMVVTGIQANDASRTIFVVAKQATNTASRAVWGFNGLTAKVGDEGGTQWGYYANQAGVATGFGGTPTDWTTIAVRFTSTASAHGYVNGGTATSFDPNDAYQAGTETLFVGDRADSLEPWNGDIAELICFNRALSDAEMLLMNDYLVNKYTTSETLFLTNLGNFPAQPIFRIYGPVTDPLITNWTNNTALYITGTIDDGDYFEIDVAKRTLVDSLGANRFSLLETASSWVLLEPGPNELTVSAEASSGLGAKVTVLFHHTFL